MSFTQAIQSGFSNYVNFSGRASRSEYNYWFLFGFLISIIGIVIDPPNYAYGESSSNLTNILTLVLLLPGLSMLVRRFHDINKSGWNYWWCLTIIGVFPVLYWIVFKAGDTGENSYGADPLDLSIDDVVDEN